MHVGLQRLSDAREKAKKNQAWTEAQQVLNVANEASKLQDAATRAFDSARKRLMDGIAATDKSLQEPLTAKADNSISGELRALFRGMPPDKRYEAINAAVQSKDMTVLQAVLGGHCLLSGLAPERQQFYTRQYRELTTPDLVTRIDVMRKALTLVEQRGPLILTEVQRALGASWDVVQKLRKSSSAAEAALLLINNPVQS